jgi:glycosyltransferase involved in cell wall biosynthesis
MSHIKPTLIGITQGRNQPSTRFRWSQYVEYLQESGFQVEELESRFGAYAPASSIKRPAWLVAGVVEDAIRTMRANHYDLRFLQRNLTATLCTWEPFLKKPFVFDVDDAIFLGARGASADRIASAASLVICGNNYLADHFGKFATVAVLPTAVDSVRFSPKITPNSSYSLVIGWSGTSSGFKYLYAIEPAIKEILLRHPTAILKVVSNERPVFKSLSNDRVVFEKWSASREVDVLQECTVGIMPLIDDAWSRGKCSFKMLTYMATAIPVVVSPIGMNVDVLSHGACGIGARTLDEWVDSISMLLSEPQKAAALGKKGREIIETRYSLAVIAPQLVELIKKLL